MFIPDIRSETALLLSGVAAITTVSPVQAEDHYVLGVCQTATQSVGTEITPTIDADSYLVNYHEDELRYKKFSFNSEGVKVTLLKAPAHGKVVYPDNPKAVKWNWFDYMPEDGYFGRDNFIMQVEKDGVKVRIEYLIEGLDEGEPATGICNQEHWKISANTSNLDNASLQALANAVGINNTFIVNTSALTGGAVGQTTGNTITLDTNAAGYGWYIDYTPYLNDEHLQISL